MLTQAMWLIEWQLCGPGGTTSDHLGLHLLRDYSHQLHLMALHSTLRTGLVAGSPQVTAPDTKPGRLASERTSIGSHSSAIGCSSVSLSAQTEAIGVAK
jgi:hypothetical protein